MTKPTQSPTWATSGSAAKADPGTTKRAQGWLVGDKVPAQHLNNELNVQGGWLDELGCGGDTLGAWAALVPAPPIGSVGTIARAGLVGDVESAQQVGTILYDVISDGIYVHAISAAGQLHTWLQATMVEESFSPRGALLTIQGGLAVDGEGWVYYRSSGAGSNVVNGIMADGSGGLRSYTFSGTVDTIACDGLNIYATAGASLEAQVLTTALDVWADLALVSAAACNDIACNEQYVAVAFDENGLVNLQVIDTATGLVHVTGDGTTASYAAAPNDDAEKVVFSPTGRLYIHTSGVSDKLQVIDYLWTTSVTDLATVTTGLVIADMAADGVYLYSALDDGANGVVVAYDERSLGAAWVQTVVGEQYRGVFSDGDRVYVTSEELVPLANVTIQSFKAHSGARRFRRVDTTYPRTPGMGRFAPLGEY